VHVAAVSGQTFTRFCHEAGCYSILDCDGFNNVSVPSAQL